MYLFKKKYKLVSNYQKSHSFKLSSGWGRNEFILFTGVSIALAGFGWAWMSSVRDHRKIAGKNALYAIEKQIDQSNNKMDPKWVESFQSVIKEHPIVTFEAKEAIANQYYRSGLYLNSADEYRKLREESKTMIQKMMVLLGEAYSLENLYKYQDALIVFQVALDLINTGGARANDIEVFKGDILLAIARCFELVRDIENAQKTYDQITKDMYNTPYAKTAQVYRSLL